MPLARYVFLNGEIVPWEEATVHVFSAGGMTIPVFPEGWNPNTLFDRFARR